MRNLIKTKSVFFLLYFSYLAVLFHWYGFQESTWLETMYLQREDYFREGIYSTAHFIYILLIIICAFVCLKERFYSFLIALVPLTNVPGISSGISMLFQGTISILFIFVLIRNIQWVRTTSPQMLTAWILIAYLTIHAVCSSIILWDTTKNLQKIILITLLKTAIPIAGIALLASNQKKIKINYEILKLGAKCQALTICTLFASILFLVSFGYNYPFGPFNYNAMFTGSRLTLGFSNPNELALWCVGVAPFLYNWSKRKPLTLKIFSWLLFFSLCYLSGSRGLILGLAIIVAAIVLLKKNSISLLISSFLSLTIIIFLLKNLREEYIFSIESRQEDYLSIIKDFLKDPEMLFLGFGLGISGYFRPQPHNMILDILFNTGIVGCILYSMFLADLLHRLYKTKQIWFFSVIGIIGFSLVHSCWTSWLFYFFPFVGILNSQIKNKTDQNIFAFHIIQKDGKNLF